MMRLNVSISVLLALLVLGVLPIGSLAKPVHRFVHRSNQDTSHRLDRAKHAAVRERSSSFPTSRTRSHGITHARHATLSHRRRRTVSSIPHSRTVQSELTVASAPKKASSGDFLKAAENPVEVSPAIAIHGTSRPEEPKETESRTRARRSVPVSKPVPVVDVIRRSSERPQLLSVEEVVATPVILPALYNKRGRLIVPPPLKGSHEILVHQNQVADRDGLDRIQNDDDLLNMRSQRLLISLPENGALEIDERLPTNRRYCRPWTAQFLATLARAHYAQFHSPLQVNSAVRTIEFQQHLVHINGNAAPAEGDTASPHLTGQAIDIAKHGLSLTEIAWLRGYLLPLVQEGKVDVEEEFQQACFHISVYRKYLPSSTAPGRVPGASHHGETTALAAAMR
jgi:hypothetical protein